MFLSISTATTYCQFYFFAFSFFILLLSHGLIVASENRTSDHQATNVGAIFDMNSRVGKEQKVAMEIAIEIINKSSNNKYNLVLHLRDSGEDALQAASAANELTKEQEVDVILCMGTWQEAVLVAGIGNRAQVPVLSLATAGIAPPLTSERWPFLVRMANDGSAEMRCVAAIIGSYRWRRVIAIYEDDAYGATSGMITLLSEALQEVGSKIEYRMVLPPFSSVYDPKAAVLEELEKMKSKQSRVFVIVQSSPSLASHLFKEAKRMGMMGKDSVWITTGAITNLLDCMNSSVISSMQGVIGIKTYFSETSSSFMDFSVKFKQVFRSGYSEEDKFEPGIHALKVYDAIFTVAGAMENLDSNNKTSKMLLERIVSSNFTGLSGEVQFKEGELSHSPVFRIVNIVGKSYKELNYWLPDYGFSESLIVKKDGDEGKRSGNMEISNGPVDWLGGLQRVPKGWVMPTDAKRMKIGIPGNAIFEKFVKVEPSQNPNKPSVSGFCIDVFEAAVELLDYTLFFEYNSFNGSYDDLVYQVYNKTFDAVVGDITILAARTKYVEFTQPFAESGLSMIVPVKSEESQKAWMFMKPFTVEMWLVTGAVIIYTMFIIWFLERGSNPDFTGPLKTQLATALWFTFSTLFFAHREKVHSNYTKIVMAVWLFVVLVLNSSYTASLTSILTVQRLEPTVTNVRSLQKDNAIVGCDGDSFVMKYLHDVLGFNKSNIRSVKTGNDYPGEFKEKFIKAAFMELPYQKVFLSNNCGRYTATKATYRFGGFGFVFPQGSPMATDISEAILELSENGELKRLEELWFPSSIECSNSTRIENESLSLQSFCGLFLLTGCTSTIAFLIYLVKLLRKFRGIQVHNMSPPDDKSLWNMTKRITQYFHNGHGQITVSA